MKYIISVSFSLLVFLPLFFLLRMTVGRPYERIDDSAWEWKMGKRTAHFLAEGKNKDSKSSGNSVLVDWGNGSRSWVERNSLPHYYKLHRLDTDSKALISSESVEGYIVGKSLNEIEESLAYAGEYKGNKITFPVKVLTKGEPLSTDAVTVTFKDSVATAVDYTQAVDSTALLYSYVPGLFFFIDRGIRAPQNNYYGSNLEEETVKKKYHFGDFTVKVVSFLLKLGLALLVLALFLAAPFLIVLPLAILAMDIFDNWIGILIGIALEVLVFIVYAGVFLVFFTLHLWPMLIVGAICAVLTSLFYKYDMYY
ncbi:MAG: hypothetical protein MJY49_04520 [Bacteroidales bacterium]|nr:hypothetical protein [Bacteroidales bacterium]